ncbi:MAG: hypothetical protein M0Z76_04190 [Gammaproteobacteria bacterium]|nr:hypothetical protein [Gammaproteobacteria bacterium]
MSAMRAFLQLIRERSDARRTHAFFARFANRTLILHDGLSLDWLTELLKLGGGGGHFRLNVAQPPSRHPTPIEWVAYHHILPLQLPLPLVCVIGTGRIDIRHLRTRGRICHPADIGWIIDDMQARGRRHATLQMEEGVLRASAGLPVDDNDYEIDFG